MPTSPGSPPKTGSKNREKVLLVGVHLARESRQDTEDHLAELALLADTAGGDVVGTVLQERSSYDAATFVGKGKARELGIRVKEEGIPTLIFDDELSPAQIRNLEEATDAKVIDRAALILDIFARRARSREARTQVELAQLQYLLPRLTRRWAHLSRQAGGVIGLRGVGETQLEIDRRIIRTRIARLKEDLAKVERGRTERRRGRGDVFTVALVGYTNAGKSTLFNVLSAPHGRTGSAMVEDRLFATLDPLVRRCRAKEGDYLLIDTVGFIRKLPHHLVASFRSTLEESAASDLLLHVVDLSAPGYEEQMTVTAQVLESLGLSERPSLLVLNKTDRAERGAVDRARTLHRDACFIAAVDGTGIPGLVRAIGAAMKDRDRLRRKSRRPDGAGAASGVIA